MPNVNINRRVVLSGYIRVSPLLLSWYNSLSVKPSSVLLKGLNELFDGVSSDGDLNEFDVFHPIGGMETAEQALRPIKTTGSANFTAVNSPTVDSTGVTGNGTTSYVNLNWIPRTNGVKYVLNSASVMIYSRTNSSSNNCDIGAFDAANTNFTQMYSRYSTGELFIRVNQGVGLSSKLVADSLGLKAGYRNNSSQIETYSNGVSLGTDSVSSTNTSVNSFYLGASNSNGTAILFSNRNISFVGIGSSLVSQSRVYSRIQSYMAYRGIAV